MQALPLPREHGVLGGQAEPQRPAPAPQELPLHHHQSLVCQRASGCRLLKARAPLGHGPSEELVGLQLHHQPCAKEQPPPLQRQPTCLPLKLAQARSAPPCRQRGRHYALLTVLSSAAERPRVLAPAAKSEQQMPPVPLGVVARVHRAPRSKL